MPLKLREYREEETMLAFERRSVRLHAATIATGLVLVGLLSARWWLADAGRSGAVHVVGWGVAVVLAAFLAFAVVTWRCPKCGASLWLAPRDPEGCPACGTSFR